MNKLVIIDDDTSIINLVKKHLDNRFEIEFTNDSSGALQFIRKKKPQLILLDLVMPGLTGVSLAHSIKSDETIAYIPLVLMTSYFNSAKEALELGADHFLKKPFNKSELEKVINKAIKIERK